MNITYGVVYRIFFRQLPDEYDIMLC